MFLSACVTPPTREQIRTANYGPVPENYQEIVKSNMKGTLFDPYTAVYDNWTGPVKGAYAQDYQGNTFYGYAVCVDINSKNQMGGYVGSRPYYFTLINGTVVHREGGYPPGTMGDARARQLCGR
jgi:hypothetical protein